MPIEFRCESCTKLLRTPDESAGKKAKCPQCGTIVDVPAGSTPEASADTPTESFQPASSSSKPVDSDNPFAGASPSAGGGHIDSDNPYASPSISSDVVQAKPLTVGELTHQKISFDDILNTAWAITRDNLGPMAIFGVVMLGVNIALTIVNQVLGGVANATQIPAVIIGANVVSVSFNMVAQTWIGVVGIMFCTRMARDRNGDLNIMSQSGPYLLRALGVTIVLAGIFLLLIAVLCGTPALVAWITTRDEATTAISAVVGMVICIIPMIVIGMNYLLSMFFVIDRQQGVFAAMGLSRKFMKGNKLTAFLTLLVMQIVGGLFVACTCCIGRVIYDPFSILVLALMYLTATGQPYERPLK